MYIMGQEEVEAVRRVIESGQLFRYRGGEGGETDTFEREWSEKIGTRYTIAMSSGTAALICGLVGLGIGPGDEVIVPGYTFMSTALAPLAVGAVPIIAEVDESLTLDPADFESRITSRTRAVIPVHMCGWPCQMDAVMEVARRHGLAVLEDACQADGGSYKGRRLGSLGDAGAFSFNQFKIIACGEGGALVTDSRELFERALIHHDSGCIYREHASGIETPFFAGSNFRINEILSAILRVQLARLDGILDALRAEKRALMRELAGESAFVFNPIHDKDGDCGTTLALLFETAAKARAFLERLKDEGIPADCPLDSGRHVYANWEPVLEQRGAQHPGRDAFRLAAVPVAYSADMCPRTLSNLERTVCIATSPTRSARDLDELIRGVKKAAARV
jgi:dTDP-4-amino-4,6-dideoxygalactose transaminase